MKNKITKRNLIIASGLILLTLLGYKFIMKKTRKPSDETLSMLDRDLVLQKGSTGAEVVELQRILKDEYGYDLGVSGEEKDGIDGVFGSLTENALMKEKGVKKITLNQL